MDHLLSMEKDLIITISYSNLNVLLSFERLFLSMDSSNPEIVL